VNPTDFGLIIIWIRVEIETRTVNILHIFYEPTLPTDFSVNNQVIWVFYTGIWIWEVCWSDHT